ncbi:cystatin-A-like [Pimephales promelas]|uniref:cystatin-A-like n=1 Tax=Pimephales promelas TaxID=90988 RepID=UPI0019557493|nr:cystatin-A-like [Pimephales promelas]KAG1931577.1 cystatin 14a, tandem [Pimephales promelas]
MSMPGGFTTVRLVTEEVKKICLKVKPEIEKMIPVNCKDYIPVFYKTQVVAGTNYLVKVDVCQEDKEEDKCVHAMIFQALPCDGGDLSVTGVQFPKLLTDPLVPF